MLVLCCRGLLKNWSLSYTGNLIGSLLLTKLVTAAGLNATPGAAAAITMAKVAKPFMQTFLKGIVCNWMVCMAGEHAEIPSREQVGERGA